MMVSGITRSALLLAILALAASATAEWRQWRGPDRAGISSETGLLREWPESGPPLAWKASGLGNGFASFSIAEGRLYTQGQTERRQYVMAFNVADGEKLWETENGRSYRNGFGDGPRGTPTVDGDRVYAVGSRGDLICVQASDGEMVWAIDLLEKFRADNPTWGLSESPLVDGDRIIVTPGGAAAGIVALDKLTGEVIWESDADRAAYSSPIVAETGAVRQYIAFTASGGVGVRSSDGKVLWRYKRVANRTANIATPILRGNHVFFSSAYGTGGALLALEGDGDDVSAKEVYFTSEMQNHYSSSVLLGEYLYGYSNRILTCMNFLTGEVMWKDRAVGKGQVVVADGLLYLLSEDGVVGLVEPSPEGYREISRFKIGRTGKDHTWTLPVIAGGKLYLRDTDTLYCYDIHK